MASSNVPIAVLISGGGTTLKNLLAVHARGELSVDFRLVISSTANAKGLQFARDAQIPYEVIVPRKATAPEDYCRANFDAVRQSGAQWVIMAGFLKHLPIPPDFEHRVVNIHPSLIPSFCGAGMYGRYVHQAVLDYGAKISGCTVHFVDNQYDHGPIIAQQAVPVLEGDTAETLAARVFTAECELYPRVIQHLARGEVRVSGRHVCVG